MSSPYNVYKGVEKQWEVIMSMILVPAYNRDYKTAAEVRKAWEGGKDFRIEALPDQPAYSGPPYTSIRDWPNGVPEHSYIRYKRAHASAGGMAFGGWVEMTFIGTWDESEEETPNQ